MDTTTLIQNFAACTSGQICLDNLPQAASGDSSTVGTILTIVIGIAAAVAVLFIAIGGFRYILSQGDPQGVTKAKSTIVYALIGLAVAILAQLIVLLVINAVTPNSTATP